MIFITDILIHFVIRKHFSNQRWWLFKFSKGYPLELSPFWAKNEILNIQNLTSNNKMYQNSRLKSPKTSTCLFVKKCHNTQLSENAKSDHFSTFSNWTPCIYYVHGIYTFKKEKKWQKKNCSIFFGSDRIRAHDNPWQAAWAKLPPKQNNFLVL